MSDPIKLKQPGDQHVMDVASCVKLPFGDYPEFEFVGRDGSVVRVPEVSALRQLGNLELTPESVVGRRVKIKRDPNKKQPAKPYWGIYLEDGESGAKATGGASNGAAGATTQPAPTAQAAVPAEKEKDSTLYLRMARFALHDVKKVYDEAGIVLTAEAAAAITATLYIQAKR